MSYRFYAEYLKPIGSKVGTAGTDTVIPIQGHEGLRLTIPRLSVSCGATPQTLTILQVEDMDQVTAFDVGAETITLESIEADLSDKHIAIEKEDGTFLFTTVSATAAKVQTLNDAPPADTKLTGRAFIFCDTNSELAQTEALAANSYNELEAPAPGRYIAADFNFPLIIHITNTTDPATVRGGAAVYISK